MRNNQKIPKGWSVKKLGEISCLIAGNAFNSEDFIDMGIPLIRISNIADDGIVLDENTAFLPESFLKENSKFVIRQTDLLIAMSGATTGKMGINTFSEPMLLNQRVCIIRAKDVSQNFLNQYLFTHKKDILRQSYGGAQPNIGNNDIKKIKVLLPPLPEQEKIALVLGTWDEAIEKLSDLIEQKKLLKKGLMQKLIYTRTNATKYKVADLFELGRGRVISKNEIDTHQGVFPVYSSQTSDNGILGYINTYDFQGEYITWTTDGANAGEVFYRNGKFNCTNVCGTAKAKEKNVNLYYAMSFLNHVSKKYVSYVGNPKLMNGVFAIIPLILPDIEIQNKVAAILSTADDEINLLNQKLEAIKEQKKGLMQQLLTGQIRVKGN